MGNLSGVIKILWVFLPLIVMGLGGYTSSVGTGSTGGGHERGWGQHGTAPRREAL